MPALYANLPRKRPKTARKHIWKHQTAVDWWDPLGDFQDPVLRGYYTIIWIKHQASNGTNQQHPNLKSKQMQQISLGNWELTYVSYQTFGNDISNQPLEKENHLQIAFSGAMSVPGRVQFIKYKRTPSFNLAAFSDPSCPILTHTTWLFFQNSWSKFGQLAAAWLLEICCDNHGFLLRSKRNLKQTTSDISILQFSTMSSWTYQQICCAFLSSKSHRAWNPGCQVMQLTWVENHRMDS